MANQRYEAFLNVAETGSFKEAAQTMELLGHLNCHLARVTENETADLQMNRLDDRNRI